MFVQFSPDLLPELGVVAAAGYPYRAGRYIPSLTQANASSTSVVTGTSAAASA
jgi:hypothetical protein